MRTLLRSLVLTLVGVAGCAERPVTELLVVADTDLAIPAQLDAIEVEVIPPTGAPVVRGGALVGDDATEIPVSLGLVHRGGPLGPVSIEVRGFRGAEPIVTRSADVSFVEGRTMVVTLHLEATCVGVVCREDETCERGACRARRLAANELEEAGPILPTLPDGGGGCVPLPELCNHADDDCDGRSDESLELDRDVYHCGACDNACPGRAHGRATCAAGLCGVSCDEGWGDCNGDPRDGCEAPLNTLSSCGTCDAACSVGHATPSCFVGACEVGSCAPGWGDCNDSSVDGCEAPLNAPGSCGGCTPCVLAGAVESCVDGTCGIAECEPGLGDCNRIAADGCETPLTTTAACGACGRSCPSVAGGSVACESGSCVVAGCTAGFADCDGSVGTGCETRLDSMADCGACGMACALPHATEACRPTGCAVVTCDAGWGDCNGIAGDGCETSLVTSAHCGTCTRTCSGSTPLCGPSGSSFACVSACASGLTMCGAGCVDLTSDEGHCGMCDRACAPPHARGVCGSGTCSIGACDPGWGDCNGSVADGCETSLNTLASCGGCAMACALPSATERCDAGRCVLVSCDAGRADCDGSSTNGCEASLTSLSSCGACGVACAIPFASESCSTGACVVGTCDAGRADCDGLVSDGCEVPLGTLTDCRACGDTCDLPHAADTCTGGTCAVASCEIGWGDCNAMAADGCETRLDSLSSCGVCGRTCAAAPHSLASCASGACTYACDAGWGDCNGMPADGCETSLDSTANCGACGTACSGATPVCGPTGAGGGVECRSACSGSLTACGVTCVDLTTSTLHCGACDAPCTPPAASGACVAGSCRIASCDAGAGDCNASVTDGCERSLRTTTDCGACGAVCMGRPHAAASCTTGTCATPCDAGWGDCDGMAGNGCERALNTVMSCGACGVMCMGVMHANVACSAGSCVVASCTGGGGGMRGDCNGIYSDGCEVDMRSSEAHCGACGHACTAGMECDRGVCVP